MTRNLQRSIALVAAIAAVVCTASCTNKASSEDPATLPFRNPALSFDERAKDLVGRLTLAEKAQQLGNFAPAIPRLGIPAYNWWSEGLHGVARAGTATVFPQAIGLAATFDEPLMHATADIIGTEFRAKYVETLKPDGSSDWYRGLTVWSPNINIFRDPRWGRGQETYGEDPYLTGRMGIAFVTGLQGDDPRYLKTVATSKHFAVHSGPESNRHREDVHPSPHDLEDTYLPAFRATVTEGKVASLMCVYNSIDGVPGCANDMLMEEHARKAWGFDGYVVSDCGAAANIYREDAHHWKPTPADGMAAAFPAGMDLICGDFRNKWTTEAEGIVAAVQNGLMKQEVVDRALLRLFMARLKLGMFDPPANVPYSRITAADNDTAAHREQALHAAQKSLVLLKNSGLLPLRKEPASIVVIGPNADSLDALVGNYNGNPSAPVTILAGIRKRFANARVTFVEGTGFIGPITSPVPAAALSGLKAEIYDNIRLEGNAAPPGSANSQAWSIPSNSGARWSGRITAPESGEYRFGFQSLDGYRVWVDDKLLIDEWGQREFPSLSTGKTTLEGGKSYALKIEAYNKHEAFANATSTIGGLVWSLPSQRGDDAVAAARGAELVLFVGGLSPRIEGEEMKITADGFAGGDRTSLDLPAPQQELLQRVQATGKPVVLVLMSGSAVSVNWADQHLPAIIETWYPGEEGGTALAGLIAGDFSPAGRLPVTFYKSVDELPPFEDYSMATRTYRYFTGEVLYPFGYGLSFTTFKYDNLVLSSTSIAATDRLAVSADVTNTGKAESDEVVQLYLSHPGVEGAPQLALKGFKRVHLKPGEKQTVSFDLHDRDLSTVDASGAHRIVAGDVKLWVGGGQPVARAGLVAPAKVAGQFTISSSADLPK
jgi:beta-glucosidase